MGGLSGDKSEEQEERGWSGWAVGGMGVGVGWLGSCPARLERGMRGGLGGAPPFGSGTALLVVAVAPRGEGVHNALVGQRRPFQFCFSFVLVSVFPFFFSFFFF